MLLRDLMEKTEITEAAADMGVDIHGLCFDTRALKAGDAFVAIRGYQSDGHDYIEEAVAKGAACVICEQAPAAPAAAAPQVPYVIVRDSRKALASMSAAWFGYPAAGLKIVGVTGTNGKTTVTTLIKQVIEKTLGAKAGLIGTNGNMIGDKELQTERTTPESYEVQELLAAMAGEGCEYVVMEVSSHALSLSRVHGIEFEVGVFTNLTPEHLDFHASMAEYADAKSRMFSSCRKSAINADDESAPIMARASAGQVFTYAIDDGAADLVGKSVKLLADRVDFCALMIGSINRVELRIPGKFSVYNALAALSAATLLGIGIESATAVLETCGGVKGRAEVVPAGKDYTVLIDYAHTPDALENIVKAALGFAGGRVVTLFGCGGDRDRKKRPLMGAVAAKYSDFVVVTTDNPRTEQPEAIIEEILAGMRDTKTPYKVIENRREAIFWALGNMAPGDVLILAGKGHETYQILGVEKTHFDEREIVAEYLAVDS